MKSKCADDSYPRLLEKCANISYPPIVRMERGTKIKKITGNKEEIFTTINTIAFFLSNGTELLPIALNFLDFRFDHEGWFVNVVVCDDYPFSFAAFKRAFACYSYSDHNELSHYYIDDNGWKWNNELDYSSGIYFLLKGVKLEEITSKIPNKKRLFPWGCRTTSGNIS